jgi:hypothetical protein
VLSCVMVSERLVRIYQSADTSRGWLRVRVGATRRATAPVWVRGRWGRWRWFDVGQLTDFRVVVRLAPGSADERKMCRAIDRPVT